MNFKGKTVVVTGGGSGIGKGICIAFAEHGANIVVGYGHNSIKAENVVKEIKAMGSDAIAVKADVTVETEVQNLVAEAVRVYGKLDVMVNNAGMIKVIAPIEKLTEKEWDDNFAVNAKGPFLCCKAAIPQMRKQGEGRIINIASQCGKVAFAAFGHYSAAKAAVLLMTQALALELADTNIRVNAVCPGTVDTEMTDQEAVIQAKQSGEDPKVLKASFVEGVPIKQFALPKDIAGAVLFLSSDYASYIHGENINVTGAQTMV